MAKTRNQKPKPTPVETDIDKIEKGKKLIGYHPVTGEEIWE